MTDPREPADEGAQVSQDPIQPPPSASAGDVRSAPPANPQNDFTDLGDGISPTSEQLERAKGTAAAVGAEVSQTGALPINPHGDNSAEIWERIQLERQGYNTNPPMSGVALTLTEVHERDRQTMEARHTSERDALSALHARETKEGKHQESLPTVQEVIAHAPVNDAQLTQQIEIDARAATGAGRTVGDIVEGGPRSLKPADIAVKASDVGGHRR